MPNIKEFTIPGSGSGTTGDQGGRDKFDWGPRQPEAGAEAAAVLRSSEHLDVPHFKIEINYPHKVEVSFPNLALGSSGRKYETEFKICLKWK